MLLTIYYHIFPTIQNPFPVNRILILEIQVSTIEVLLYPIPCTFGDPNFSCLWLGFV